MRLDGRVPEGRAIADARLKALLASLDDLVFELDEDGTYLGAWTADQDLLVAPPEWMLGRDVHEVLGPELGESMMVRIQAVLDTGTTATIRYPLEVPAGIRWFEGRITPIAGTSPRRLCLLVRDVTEQYRREVELSRQLECIEVMRSIDRAILSSGSVSELSATVLRTVREMVGADRASLLLFEPAARTVSVFVVDPPAARSQLPPTLRFEELSAAAREPSPTVRHVPDLRSIAAESPILRQLVAAGLRSTMSVTLVDEGVAVGELNVSSVRVEGLDAEDGVMLADVGRQIAVALRQMRLKEEAAARTRDLQRTVEALARSDEERRKLLVRLRGSSDEHAAWRQRVQDVVDGVSAPAIVFQPIVSLATSEVMGLEALSRFESQPRFPPDAWFDWASLTGLGVELELAAVDAALRHVDELPANAFLSLNCAPATIQSPDLRIRLRDRLPPERLVLELTEHAQIEDYEALRESLAPLRRAGVRFAVDDAGAGYASLRHILQLAPDVIKLDISLTRRIDASRAQLAMAAALVAFGRETGALLVAEGIEEEGELQTLLALGVELGQGYYLARPAPAGEAPWRSICGPRRQ
jgi:EAL domain-containing protein (putative c-di-GMP-specific phosphodiesterase class I)